MSSTDFLPRTDAGLLAWATPFSSKITATPTAYSCTAPQATLLASLLTAYTAALAAATDPETRGQSTVYAKDQARVNLVANIRALARQIQGATIVTNQQRVDLGLTVRAHPSPIGPPATSPVVETVSVNGRTWRVRLHDETSPQRRGRPLGVSGAALFSFIGATPPTSVDAWKFEGNTTRTDIQVVFDSSLAPGTQVWLTAFWYSPRAQSGPACTPVSLTFGAAGVSNVA